MPSSTPPRQQGSLSFRHILLLRLINALTMATFFQPDEYFQALEPAYQVAFGAESNTWVTWEWKHQLRSSLHPLLFSIPYLVVDGLANALGLSTSSRSSLLVASPAVLQGFIAAIGDWYTWKLAEHVYGTDTPASTFAVILQLTNPWQWYCSSRTFSNSLETTLTVAGLAHWPWQLHLPPGVNKGSTSRQQLRPTNLRIALALAAFAVLLRPTNLLIWATIGLSLLPSLRIARMATLLREAAMCGTAALIVSALADRAYFGFWTFPPYNWLYFNMSRGLAVFYGRNPWHYYLLQGIPLLCTMSLPFALLALWRPRSPRSDSPSKTPILRTLASTVYVTVLVMSLIAHKEVRFIYPLLPVLSILAAPHAASFFTARGPAAYLDKKGLAGRPERVLRHGAFLAGGLALNVLVAGYLSYMHQRAPIQVVNFLRSDFETRQGNVDPEQLYALFLMPCHSTPWRSHLVHPDLRAYALSCEPPLHTEPRSAERESYRDEADRFYDDSELFLRTEMFPARKAKMPRYIVGFEESKWRLEKFFNETRHGRALGVQLQEVWSANNGLFAEDWRRAGKMIVWETGKK